MKVARVIYQELGIGAVAITDRDKLLAFIGIGDDHHLPGTPIASVHSHRAIDNNEVVYADAGYQGVDKRREIVGDEHLSGVRWQVAARKGALKQMHLSSRRSSPARRRCGPRSSTCS